MCVHGRVAVAPAGGFGLIVAFVVGSSIHVATIDRWVDSGVVAVVRALVVCALIGRPLRMECANVGAGVDAFDAAALVGAVDRAEPVRVEAVVAFQARSLRPARPPLAPTADAGRAAEL